MTQLFARPNLSVGAKNTIGRILLNFRYDRLLLPICTHPPARWMPGPVTAQLAQL
jgi:hypothetical protein